MQAFSLATWQCTVNTDTESSVCLVRQGLGTLRFLRSELCKMRRLKRIIDNRSYNINPDVLMHNV